MTELRPHAERPANRLTLFLPDLDGGGAERVALALLQGFIERGHTVDLVLVRKRGALLPLVPPQVEIIDLGAHKLRDAVWPLVRYLRQRRPQALHAMMWPLPLIAVVARGIARVDTRIVGSEHSILSKAPIGLRRKLWRTLTRRAYLNADALVAVSAGVADDLSALVGLPRDRISVIHNPLLLPATLPDPAAAVTRWPTQTKRILAVGSLKPEKNYPLLLRALAEVRKSVPASLLILGDGNLRGTLETQAVAAGLADAVVFVGFELDPWPYFAAADLFVLSSDNEGLGNVLIEALHAGLLVVSTDCPSGPREVLAGGEFGRLVECGNSELLAAAIVAALDDTSSSAERAARQARASALAGQVPLTHHLAVMTGVIDDERAA